MANNGENKLSDPRTALFEKIVESVERELDKAVKKFPTWPSDPLHAMSIVQEEVGELDKAVLQRTYEPEKSSIHDIENEAIQSIGMLCRFLFSLDVYRFEKAEQHEQNVATCYTPNAADLDVVDIVCECGNESDIPRDACFALDYMRCGQCMKPGLWSVREKKSEPEH